MTPSRLGAWGIGASLVGLIACVDACRTLEPRAADDDAGASSSSSSSSGNASSSGSSTSSSGGSSGGSSGSTSSSSSSSSSGEVLPPFDGGVILPAGDHSLGPNDRLGTLTVPTGYAGEPMPLVLLLHGTGESQASIESYLQFKPTANAKGFFLLRASARNNVFGVPAWNADAACCSYLASPPDDSGYLSDLVSRAGAVVAVDAKRVYVVGHSSGGFMAYRLACDHADVFAGMVSIAGGADDATTCNLTAPVSVLQVHGTSDLDVAYAGGSFGVGYSYPGAVASVSIWSGYNGCSSAATSGPARTILASNDTSVSSYEGCEAGGAAELWSIAGARHKPSYPAGFSGQLSDWLLARPKP